VIVTGLRALLTRTEWEEGEEGREERGGRGKGPFGGHPMEIEMGSATWKPRNIVARTKKKKKKEEE